MLKGSRICLVVVTAALQPVHVYNNIIRTRINAGQDPVMMKQSMKSCFNPNNSFSAFKISFSYVYTVIVNTKACIGQLPLCKNNSGALDGKRNHKSRALGIQWALRKINEPRFITHAFG